MDDFSLIELSGKDAETFLQGRTSNDVKAVLAGHGQQTSFLDRKGYLIAFLSIHRIGSNYLLLSDMQQSPVIMKELATYHFREDISYRETAQDYRALTVHGPIAESFILDNFQLNHVQLSEGNVAQALRSEHAIVEGTAFGKACRVLRRSISGDPGFVILVDKGDAEQLSTEFSKVAAVLNLISLSAQAYDVLRIEAGVPHLPQDISGEHMLPETGLEQSAASYNKGCFQGQEVLARIKTYGAPKKALVGLEFELDPPSTFALDTVFSVNGEDAGIIKSNCFSPTLKRFIALAYISRDYRLPGRKLEIETSSGKFPVTVRFLPFYAPAESKERSKKIYETALQEFALGSEQKAITMLREAVELDPLFMDAYESLGVILSRHEQVDEAIALMHRLLALDPDSIMAHTNLSVYYMQQGDKEKAEEEKAISMSIRMSQLAKEAVAEQKQKVDSAKIAEEAEKRLAMFQQVLNIDPDDLLANNGVGSIYVELAKYEEALPFLHKAIQVKPTHTVAYVALGKAYEQLGRIADASRVYNHGIEVAAKRGDITPMKEMQGLLALLESRV